MIDKSISSACDRSDIVSSISFGRLSEYCTTDQAILDLIEHIRECKSCGDVLEFINEEEPTFPEFFDARLNDALISRVTPDPLPLSSDSEEFLREGSISRLDSSHSESATR